MITRTFAALALVLALVSSQGCAVVTPPPTLTPVGQIAFYGDRVIKAIDTLQDLAINAESSQAISTEEARKVVLATRVAALAAEDLSKALKAGESESAAKAKAVAAIKEALRDVPSQLSPATSKLVTPYVTTVLTLLTVFGGN